MRNDRLCRLVRAFAQAELLLRAAEVVVPEPDAVGLRTVDLHEGHFAHRGPAIVDQRIGDISQEEISRRGRGDLGLHVLQVEIPHVVANERRTRVVLLERKIEMLKPRILGVADVEPVGR